MRKISQGTREALWVTGVMVLVLLALPLLMVGAFVARAMLLALVLAAIPVAVLAYVASPRLRAWVSLQGLPEISYKGLRLSTDVRLASAHTWARDVWREATIGVDDLAQSTLGPVTRVDLPKPGLRVQRGAPLFRLFHDGRTIVARAPVDGEVTAVNDRLQEDPGLVNAAPYGAGWAVRLKDRRIRRERRDLLGGVEARDWFRCEVDRLIAELAPATVPATMPDGGLVSAELYRFIEPAQWTHLNASFFDADEVAK